MRKQYITLIQNSLQFLWGFAFLLFPLFFLIPVTENFVFPKQILIGFISLLSLIAISVQTLLRRRVEIRQTFLDLPVFIFLLALILSAIFSVNRYDSLISLVPWIFLAVSFYILTNLVRYEQIVFFFSLSILVSACILSVLTIFSFLKTYLLPFGFTHVQWFTPMGSLLDQAIYLTALLPLALYFSYPLIKGKSDGKVITFSLASLILIAGIFVSVFQLFTSQKPIILPFGTGFQIAFAAISQDMARTAQAFFFGSGPGTFFTDFTRFKQASFNANQNLWFLNFNQSSSFVLELLATAGIVGVLGYLGIIVGAFSKPMKTFRNPLSYSLLILLIASLFLPFSFTTVALLFFLLAIFAGLEGFKHPEKSFDVELSLVALKKNLFTNPLQSHDDHPRHTSLALPIVFVVATVGIAGIVGYFSGRYVIADVLFAKSLAAAANNDATRTYNYQRDAINIFPFRDGYYRVFSQTNLSIANSLLTLNSSKGSSPNSQVQTTALNLIQQSINVGRSATAVSPLNSLNWQNLASIYRALINFGQNADKFSIASTQQAILLDPTNPQEYIALGGLYFQLNDYDNAAKQFQIAINLKPDYPNAYYNLGHAYEAKGDLANGLTNYQTVQNLVANDKNNLNKITGEITALQKRINTQTANNQTNQKQVKAPSNGAGAVAGASTSNSAAQEPLNVNQPQTQLPQQPTQIALPQPTTVPTVSPSPAPSGTSNVPSVTPSPTPAK